jgi:hypothetical protein
VTEYYYKKNDGQRPPLFFCGVVCWPPTQSQIPAGAATPLGENMIQKKREG